MERLTRGTAGRPPGSYSFDELSVLQQGALVFDLARLDPGLDLVSEPLQLLDLLLEIRFVLLLLVAVGSIVDFLPDVFKKFHTFSDFFQTAVNFTCNTMMMMMMLM